MPVRLLAVGDIHLGRRPSGLSDALLERLGASALGPEAAWELTVDRARRLAVDAVLLAGDVVEQNDDFYEAYPALRAGVERLAESGIAVIGVAGNHDDQVLPRLADALDRFRLLGRGGIWETVEVASPDGATIDVLGWSFPSAVVDLDPLASLPALEHARPVVGLLHCDRNQPRSPYAPVRGADLEAAPTDAWLLGHIHVPDTLVAPRPVGYLGSLTALDPGEIGARGPWLVEVEHRGAVTAEHLQLAPLRFERLQVALDDLEHPDEVHERIVRAVDDLDDRLARAGAAPRAVGCRLVLSGRSSWRGAVAARLERDDPSRILDVRGGVAYFIESWHNALEPALDLEAAARESDPVGRLAQRLLLLRRAPDDPARRALVEPLLHELGRIAAEPGYARLERPAPDAARAAALLEEAALRALDALLEQRRGSS